MEELAAIFEQVVSGLRGVHPVSGQGLDGLRTILNDLDPPMMKWGVAVSLTECLEGTFAGEQYDSMRAHSALMDTRRAEREEYESPEAVKARRKRRRVESAKIQQRRQEEKASRDQERDQILSELEGLSGADRLVRMLSICSRLPLDGIPDHLVPLDAELSSLHEDIREQLSAKIDKRRGSWRRLRKKLIALGELEDGGNP